MFVLPQSRLVDQPCRELLTYPLQCFQELFLATPAVVGNFIMGIGGFAIAVLIWGAIFALTLFAIFFVLKHLYKAARYFFTSTRVGQKISSMVPVSKYMQKFCSKAQSVGVDHPKKLINTQAIGEYGANIVSKVHVDSKWFKNAFKHVPFTKSAADHDVSTTTQRSPSKTPQRSTSRISALTPKILSPKFHKA